MTVVSHSNAPLKVGHLSLFSSVSSVHWLYPPFPVQYPQNASEPQASQPLPLYCSHWQPVEDSMYVALGEKELESTHLSA